MTGPIPRGRALPVPSARLTRVLRLGGVASGIAAGAAAKGLGGLARGERPAFGELMLTPGNLARLADELARLRGAAMKMGQLLSMDTGELLPPELSEVFARLRAEADHMPPRQLRDVLEAEWGRTWLKRFRRFDVRPIAAASIGQVHKAETSDGRVLAIKVQYPGVRRSIDSDVANVGWLIRRSGLMPEGTDLEPFLAEARRQLHEEADYAREGEMLDRFSRLLADDDGFAVPALDREFTTDTVLAMTYLPGEPVEGMTALPQAVRDDIVRRLLDLMLRELFAFGLVQTDPNFANYRHDAETGRVVLLDFGAVRAYPADRVADFRRLIAVSCGLEDGDLDEAAVRAGLIGEDTAPHHREAVLGMIREGARPFLSDRPFDFADRSLVGGLRDRGMALAADRSFTHIQPMDVLYLQRKTAGMYLLAHRLGARVALRPLLERHLGG